MSLYSQLRFVVRRLVLFFSGYLFARPLQPSNRLFALWIGLMALYSLWAVYRFHLV